MMSRAQRWFVSSRIYTLAPVKYLLTRVVRKQLSQQTPFERHVGLVGEPADGFATRVVCDVIEKEDFATILRLQQNPVHSFPEHDCALHLPAGRNRYSGEQLCLCCRAAREHGVTIQSVVQAATVKTASQLIKTRADDNSQKLGTEQTIVSPQLFKHLPPESFPDDVSKIVCLFWPMSDKIDVQASAEKDFWQLAKEVKEANRKLLVTSLKQTTVVFPVMREVFPAIQESLNGKRIALLAYTNHGDCSWVNGGADARHSVDVTSVFTYVYQSRPIGPVYGHFVATVGGRLFWSLNYSNDVIDEAGAREHLQQSVRTLMEACRPQEGVE